MPDLFSLGINGNLQDHFSSHRTDTVVDTLFILDPQSRARHRDMLENGLNIPRKVCLESHKILDTECSPGVVNASNDNPASWLLPSKL